MNDTVISTPVGNDYRPMGKYGLLNALGIKMKESNLNPSNDERAEDCVIRAILAVINDDSKDNFSTYTWDFVYDKLASKGREMHRLMNNYWVVQDVMKGFGYQLVVPSKEVQLGTFLYTNKAYNYIVSVNNHAFAYIHGTIYDTKSMFNEIVYNLSSPLKAIYVPKDVRIDKIFR